MFGSIGITELLIIGAIAALLFGPKQLPKLGRALGDTLREMRGIGKAIEEDLDK